MKLVIKNNIKNVEHYFVILTTFDSYNIIGRIFGTDELFKGEISKDFKTINLEKELEINSWGNYKMINKINVPKHYRLLIKDNFKL